MRGMDPAIAAARPGLPRPVAVEELRAAVRAARSWRGVMRALGFTGSRTGRVLRAICDEHAIDYAHFRHARADVHDLAELVASSSSWDELLTSLGYAAESGSARATVRKHCRRRGIDLSKLTMNVPPTMPEHRLTPDPAFLRRAAPYLVAAALTLAGAAVSLAPEGVAYDLLADVPDQVFAACRSRRSRPRRVGRGSAG